MSNQVSDIAFSEEFIEETNRKTEEYKLGYDEGHRAALREHARRVACGMEPQKVPVEDEPAGRNTFQASIRYFCTLEGEARDNLAVIAGSGMASEIRKGADIVGALSELVPEFIKTTEKAEKERGRT